MMARGSCRAFSSVFSFSAVLMVALTLPAATASVAQPAAVYGGTDGRYFEFGCAPGQVLVGLRASAGILIDNAQAICARLNSSGGFAGAAPQGPVFGSGRAQDQHVECPQGFAVAGASIGKNEHYPHVGAIQLTCRELANRAEGGTAYVEVRGSGNLEGHLVTIGVGDNPGGDMPGMSLCPNNYATGIRGRAGDYLSAFGLICGQAVAVAEPAPPKTLNKRKKASILAKDPNAFSTTTSIPQAQKTLNKRRRPGSWGTPPPDQQTGGAGGASLNSDGNVNAYTKSNGWTGSSSPPATNQPPAPEQAGNMGASLNSDGGTGATSAAAAPPAEAAPASQGPSPLISGMYATIVAITESRCLFQGDLRGSAQGMLDLTPRPGIMIPLNQYSGFFSGPVTLNVEGLRLSQSTTVPIRAGPITGPAPARFDGEFTEDGSQFDVRFQAGTDFCRIGGTIHGTRN